MIDPYTYREKIKQPKLIFLGNNDPFWATDALNLYWDGLEGSKWIHYVPNAGHNLSPRLDNGGNAITPSAVSTMTAFIRAELTGKPLPVLSWKHEDTPDGKASLTVTSSSAPLGATLWVAHSASHDFRKAKWEKQRIVLVEGKPVTASIQRPRTGSTAFYAALDFCEENSENPYTLCTQLRIIDAPDQAGGSGRTNR